MNNESRLCAAETAAGKLTSRPNGFRLEKLSVVQLRRYREILIRVEATGGDTASLSPAELSDLADIENAMTPEKIPSDPVTLARLANEYEKYAAAHAARREQP
jgi:hypothetical protein